MTEGTKVWGEEYCTKAGRPPVSIVTSESAGQSQQMLNQGRVEGAMMGGGALAYQNSREGNKYVVLGKPGAKANYGWGFRKDEGVDISYTKDFADLNHPNLVTPEKNQLYIGWTADGECHWS